MRDWQQKEAIAMDRLQEALQVSIEKQTGSDTDSGDDQLPRGEGVQERRKEYKFKLPHRLRGWLYLMRADIELKDQIQVLQATSGSFM